MGLNARAACRGKSLPHPAIGHEAQQRVDIVVRRLGNQQMLSWYSVDAAGSFRTGNDWDSHRHALDDLILCPPRNRERGDRNG
jgi:hypothetical protein